MGRTSANTGSFRQPFKPLQRKGHAQELAVPQSEYPLNVGKSAVPVEVPVTPKLTPEVLEGIDDEGGRVEDEEEGIDVLFS